METDPSTSENTDNSRRSFIKKASYAAPVVLTLTAMPAMANRGSRRRRRRRRRRGN